MRFSVVIFCLIVAITCVLSTANAQDDALMPARVAARYDLDRAKLELRDYWQIEYPRQQRELNAAIELTEAELENNQCLLREFRPFPQFTIDEPYPIIVRNLEFCIKECELRLKNLHAERTALVRFHDDRFHLLQMKVVAARLRVAQLEANDDIASEPVAK
ncbi:MAG TPA: hypothetical protein VFW73_11095 [Lacipirellulaceae bacterium]|nr:hypothetical protein [Lacipirellulaceae bacterium]